eukprot:GILJ01014747.1.p1 GENE.GILJ01014747.1~~GILJ01014747.1.p1  ORF type:complete len:1045 (-),score=134.25 GILJ01014747.1:225-3359(-)
MDDELMEAFLAGEPLSPEDSARILHELAGKQIEPAATQMPSLPTLPPPQASADVLPANVLGHICDVFHERLISALGDPHVLLKNDGGIRLSEDLDFGLKDCLPFEGAVLTSEPFAYSRSIVIRNYAQKPIYLFKIVSAPSRPDIFRMRDDYLISLQRPFDMPLPDKQHKVVKLSPSSEYHVTVDLNTVGVLEGGVIRTFIVFGFFEPVSQKVLLLGRQVVATLIVDRNTRSLLNPEAQPFYPSHLRTLFDSVPVDMTVGIPPPITSCIPPEDVVPACYRSSLMTETEAMTMSENYQLLFPVSGKVSDEPHLVHLRKLYRLLALEEMQMHQDIKKYDMFSTSFGRHKQDPAVTILDVPGIVENRPSVHIGDIIYARVDKFPLVEHAGYVYAIQRSQIYIRFSLELHPILTFNSGCSLHIRFSFDPTQFQIMRDAILQCVKLPDVILPKLPQNPESLSNQPPGQIRSAAVGYPAKKTILSNRFNSPAPTTPNGEDNGGVPSTADPIIEPGSSNTAKLVLFNSGLNAEQREVIQNVLHRTHGSIPYIVFGPPGTGKTVTLVETVKQVYHQRPQAKILLCAPANFAADSLCVALQDVVQSAHMIRLNDCRRPLNTLKKGVLPYCILDPVSNLFTIPPDEDLIEYRIIITTCAAASLLYGCLPSNHFQYVFIDESAHALEPEVLIPLSLVQQPSAIVLVGDPKQLGAVVRNPLAERYGLGMSLQERLSNLPLYYSSRKIDPSKSYTEAGKHRTRLLLNYRSHPSILEFFSNLFYLSSLKPAADSREVDSLTNWDQLPNRKAFPLMFYGVEGRQMREENSPSWFNFTEASKIVELIKKLISDTHITDNDIGVMAPYRAQVYKIRQILRANGLQKVRVGAVDDYQGQEEQVIFISTVVTNPALVKSGEQLLLNNSIASSTRNNTIDNNAKHNEKEDTNGTSESLTADFGFLRSAKRFNVAVTRAKALMVIIGHPTVLMEDPYWKKMLEYCVLHQAYRGCAFSLADESPGNLEEVVRRMASLAVLGVGDRDRVYQSSVADSYREELEWRVML